jgi:membrane protein implicated in regulation of membrane protease activity
MSQPQQLCSFAALLLLLLLLPGLALALALALLLLVAALSHLCCSCDHVLHVICVPWAVHVCVVTLLRLILHCRNTAVQPQHLRQPKAKHSNSTLVG